MRLSEEFAMKKLSAAVTLVANLFLVVLVLPTAAQTADQRQLVLEKTWPLQSKRFAIVIGIDEYTDKQITKLEGASNDARALASVLTEQAGFPADQVFLFTSDQPSDDRRPTRANILDRLSKLRGSVPKDGLLLL